MTEETAQELLKELRAIRALLVPSALAIKINATENVLSKAEAMAFTKKSTPRSFGDWRRKFKVRPVGRNRFSRQALELALLRESGNLPMPRTLKERRR